MFTYIDKDGREVSEPAAKWLDYAMGYDLKGEMPLFVKPSRKITVKNVADVMRDHFEGTPMDMTTDIGAGGNALPYRWRPMSFTSEGKTSVNERAIATQQTGFWFVGQARGWLPDDIGALIWFGCDDAATSYLTPIYASTRRAPLCLREGNGDLLHYSSTSAFWICNRVANACYKMYNYMAAYVREAIDSFENLQMEKIRDNDARLLRRRCKCFRRNLATRLSTNTAQDQFYRWRELEETLLVKFIDGNVKAQDEDGSFRHSQWSEGIPDGLEWPGYTQKWKDVVAKDHGKVLEQK